MGFGLQLAKDTQERTFGTRTAGLRRAEAAARSVLTDRSKLETSPQPSGWACDVEEQPSARGRLRAAAAFTRLQLE